MKPLHIDSSLLGEQSVSRLLSKEIVAAWQSATPQLKVTYRDLAQVVPPQLTGELLGALRFQKPLTTPESQAALAVINQMLDEFLAADAVVIGVPMYNFSVPTQLKAWIDALAQAGKTFAYTPEGPRGLAGDKRVILTSSRGNIYSTPAMAPKDFQEPDVIAALKFMGIQRFDVIRTEGVNRSPEIKAAALASAREAIAELFTVEASAKKRWTWSQAMWS